MIFFKKKEIPLNKVFNTNFVDIHSHLLPGIDDGAKDIDNSIELIKTMCSYGINNFVTTPHILGNVYPNTSKLILEKAQLVRNELEKREMHGIHLRAAAEYMMDEKFVELLNKKDLLPIKENYILVEMSYFNAPFNLFDILFEIQLKGYKPILAHPERYIFYHKDFNIYYKLKKAGCLFQLNLLSLTAQYGKAIQKITYKILEKELYDFVGTDTHHMNHLRLLKKIGNKKTIKQIAKLLKNNEIFK